MIVVSCPPCWVPVQAKTLPTLPISAPLTQSPPVWSRKLRIWAHMLPKRVGVPKMIASASASCSGSATGTWANACRAAFAPLFSSASSGTSSATWNSVTSAPATCRGPLGDRLGHPVDVAVHAVEDDLDLHRPLLAK